MKKTIHFVILLLFIFQSSASFSQTDTLKVMSYNVLNYGFPPTTDCPALAAWNKHQYLRTIVQYVDPDIVGFVKMTASPSSFSTDTISQKVLDSVCVGCYSHCAFTNNSGYTKENMLFYKNSKFGFVGTTTIYSSDPNISDLNLHRLYYKSADLATTHDTVFLNIILVHLKSGDTDSTERATEITGVMNWLNTHVSSPGNYIFMGDMNTQTSNETCFQLLIGSSNNDTRFSDPENQLGDWSDFPFLFSNYLTQSTRVNDPGDCGAIGGINDRFDQILCSQTLMSGANHLQYIPGSFNVIGQDGNHNGVAINDPPANTSVPSNVLNALYTMSNHLPVSVKIAFSSSVAGIKNPGDNFSEVSYDHIVSDELKIRLNEKNIFEAPLTVSICNLEGRKLSERSMDNQLDITICTQNFSSGIYLLMISDGNKILFKDKFIKIPE